MEKKMYLCIPKSSLLGAKMMYFYVWLLWMYLK